MIKWVLHRLSSQTHTKSCEQIASLLRYQVWWTSLFWFSREMSPYNHWYALAYPKMPFQEWMPFRNYTSISMPYITRISMWMTSTQRDCMLPRHTNIRCPQSPSASKSLTVKTTKLLPSQTPDTRVLHCGLSAPQTRLPLEVTLTDETEISPSILSWRNPKLSMWISWVHNSRGHHYHMTWTRSNRTSSPHW